MKTKKQNLKNPEKIAKNIKKDKDFNSMDDESFNDLVKSIKQAKEIILKMKKEKTEEEKLNIVQIRKDLKLSQEDFSLYIGVKSSTLKNWEQGRVKVPGIAKTLFRIVQKHPETLLA